MKYTRDNKRRLTSSFISPNSFSLRNVVGGAMTNGKQFKYSNPCFRVKFRGLTLQKDANINHILNERLQKRCSLTKTTAAVNKGKGSGMWMNEIILSPKNINTGVAVSSVRNSFMRCNEYDKVCNPLVEKYGVDSVFYLKYKMKRCLSGLVVNTNMMTKEEGMKRTYSSGWRKMSKEKTFSVKNVNINVNIGKSVSGDNNYNYNNVSSNNSISIYRNDVLGCSGSNSNSNKSNKNRIRIYKRRPKSFYAFGRSYKEQFHKKYNAIKNEYIKSKL